MGTWDRGSQWCNRLLWIIVILRGRFFVVAKGEREGKGGDGARLAFEEIGRARGRTLVLAIDTHTTTPSPRTHRHSTSSWAGWWIALCLNRAVEAEQGKGGQKR